MRWDRDPPIGKSYPTATIADGTMVLVAAIWSLGIAVGGGKFGVFDDWVLAGIALAGALWLIPLAMLCIRRCRTHGLDGAVGLVDAVMIVAGALVCASGGTGVLSAKHGDLNAIAVAMLLVSGAVALSMVLVRGFVLDPRMEQKRYLDMDAHARAVADAGTIRTSADGPRPIWQPLERNAGRIEAAEAVASVEDAMSRIRGSSYDRIWIDEIEAEDADAHAVPVVPSTAHVSFAPGHVDIRVNDVFETAGIQARIGDVAYVDGVVVGTIAQPPMGANPVIHVNLDGTPVAIEAHRRSMTAQMRPAPNHDDAVMALSMSLQAQQQQRDHDRMMAAQIQQRNMTTSLRLPPEAFDAHESPSAASARAATRMDAADLSSFREQVNRGTLSIEEFNRMWPTVFPSSYLDDIRMNVSSEQFEQEMNATFVSPEAADAANREREAENRARAARNLGPPPPQPRSAARDMFRSNLGLFSSRRDPNVVIVPQSVVDRQRELRESIAGLSAEELDAFYETLTPDEQRQVVEVITEAKTARRILRRPPRRVVIMYDPSDDDGD